MRRRRSRLVVGLLCAALPAAIAAGPVAARTEPPKAATTAVPRTSLNDIEDEVMCPICGTALGLSESPQADRERAFIQRLIDSGRTKQQVKDALVNEYGREVLAVPDDNGFDLAAWLVPIAGLLLAALAIGFGVRRWRRTPGGDEDPLPPPLAEADAARLDADLARYD